MSKKLATFDRILLGLLGIILIALGVWPILINFNVEFAEYLAEWVDHDTWRTLGENSWWVWVLAGASALLLIIGLWLIVVNLRHRRFNNVESAASNEEGAISASMNAIATAVAKDLDALEGVDRVERLVAYDRARPTLQYTVVANPDTPLERLTNAVETNERDFREAFPDADLDTSYKLHFTKVKPMKDLAE